LGPAEQSEALRSRCSFCIRFPDDGTEVPPLEPRPLPPLGGGGGGGGAVTEAGVGEGHGLAGPAYRPDNALNSLCRPITTICVDLNGTEMLLSGCVEV
jgi:hypothetical protein